jgi:SynChlorMet cassette protein ScmC
MKSLKGLRLADGTSLCIAANDCRAEPIVDLLVQVMQLRPDDVGERLLLAAVDDSAAFQQEPRENTVICLLKPPKDDAIYERAMELSLSIARDVQSRGGVLVHGGLAALGGEGVIMAAPGGTGKTTASGRLPPPWRSLSDDATLVVRDTRGRYFAHPWPTWSRFWNGPGGTWPIEEAVPLRAVFFLARASTERVEPLNSTVSVAMLMQSVEQITRPMTWQLPPEEVHQIHRQQLANVADLAKAVPAFTLHLSLTGRFWDEMERTLKALKEPIDNRPSPAPPISTASILGDSLPVVLTGRSMMPFLRSGDLLEVMPLCCAPKRGDVIYYKSPDDGKMVVHRVVSLTAAGAQTRGDNNANNDSYVVPLKAIIGQVVAANRNKRRFNVSGGWQGTASSFIANGWRGLLSTSSLIVGEYYRILARTGLCNRLLPAPLKPRLVAFGPQRRQHLKLIWGRSVLGHYNNRAKQWQIRLPFRLFVDESALDRASAQVEEARKQAKARALKGLHVVGEKI